MYSLREKLAEKTRAFNEEQLVAERSKAEAELAPIRQKINKLEKRQQKLEILKNSLIAKTNKAAGDGPGMSEYAQQVLHRGKTEAERVDELMVENRAALAEMGIKDLGDLVARQEFAESDEVLNYQEAQRNLKDLKQSDEALWQEFNKLAITPLNQETSYEQIAIALQAELEVVEREIISEKIKTPEGRQEVILSLAEKISQQLPKFSFDRDASKNYFLNDWGNHYHRNVYFNNNQRKGDINWKTEKIIPNKLTEIIELAGPDLSLEAIKTAYSQQLEQEIKKFDDQHEKWRFLNEQISTDQEILNSLPEQLREFSKLQERTRAELLKKSEEFKESKIDFNSDRVTGYGTNYQYFIEIQKDWSELITEEAKNTNLFPKIQPTKLQDYLSKSSLNLEDFIKDIKKLSSEADVKSFLKDEKKGIRLIHHNHYDAERLLRGSQDNLYSKFNETFPNIKTLTEAKEIISRAISEQNNAKIKILDGIMTAVSLQLKKRELDAAIDRLGIDSYAKQDVGHYLSNLEKDKQSAQRALLAVKEAMRVLPKDKELILNNHRIVVPAVEAARNSLNEYLTVLLDNLRLTKKQLEEHQQKKPKLFGLKTWENKLNQILNDKKTNENALSDQKEKIASCQKQCQYYIDNEEYSRVNYLFKDLKAQGTSEEIFTGLINELQTVINQEVPIEINKLYQEYSELEKRLP